MNGVRIRTAATNSITLTLLLVLVTPRPTFLFFNICAPPHSLPSASCCASTAFAGQHSVCCFPVAAAAPEYLHLRSTDPFLTFAVAHVRFQHGDDEAGEAMLHDKVA